MTSALHIPVTFNARGLGGIVTETGGTIAPVLFRSDSLAGLTEQGLRRLAELRIGTVVDLRTEGERERAADVLPADGSVRLLPLPIQGGAMDEMMQKLLPSDTAPVALTAAQISEMADQVPTLEDLYIAILESSPAQFAALARAVIEAADSDRPGVLFHCTVGKDRTGLAAALLLLTAGVSRPHIVADYAQTQENLAGPFRAPDRTHHPSRHSPHSAAGDTRDPVAGERDQRCAGLDRACAWQRTRLSQERWTLRRRRSAVAAGTGHRRR